MMHLPGFGPKRARRLYDELGIDSLEKLRGAAERQQLRGLRGFGPKAEEKLLEQLAAGYDGTPAPRWLLSRAQPIAEQIVDALRAAPGRRPGRGRRLAAPQRRLGQGPRRRRHHDRRARDGRGAHRPPARRVGAEQSGDAGARVMLHAGMKVDLKVVEPDQFGNVLQHFTGSKDHNVALRESAVKRGLHVSEYGILDDADGRDDALRDRGGRLRAARAAVDPARAAPGPRRAGGGRRGTLPELIELGDLRGDLHSHTVLSDGRQDVEAMLEGARARGYEYLAITDHSASHGFGNDVQPDALRAQIERIRALDAELDDFDAADRDRDEHPHERGARLRRRAARRARLGRRLRPHVVRDVRGGHDGAHDRRHGAPVRRPDRPPDGAQDRVAAALPDRHGARDRGGRAHAHDARDQRRARPPRPQRDPRARRGGGGRADPA